MHSTEGTSEASLLISQYHDTHVSYSIGIDRWSIPRYHLLSLTIDHVSTNTFPQSTLRYVAWINTAQFFASSLIRRQLVLAFFFLDIKTTHIISVPPGLKMPLPNCWMVQGLGNWRDLSLASWCDRNVISRRRMPF
jgi:hypothetical protein